MQSYIKFNYKLEYELRRYDVEHMLLEMGIVFFLNALQFLERTIFFGEKGTNEMDHSEY